MNSITISQGYRMAQTARIKQPFPKYTYTKHIQYKQENKSSMSILLSFITAAIAFLIAGIIGNYVMDKFKKVL